MDKSLRISARARMPRSQKITRKATMAICHCDAYNDWLCARIKGNIPTNLLDAIESF